MSVTSRESLDRLEHEVRQARATVSSELAQVRHRLEPEQIKRQAEETKDRLMKSGAEYCFPVHRRPQTQAQADGAGRRDEQPGSYARRGSACRLVAMGSSQPNPGAASAHWRRGSRRADAVERWHRAPRSTHLPRCLRSPPAGAIPLPREGIGGRLSSMAEPASQAAGRARELAQEAGTRISEVTARTGSAVSDMAGRTAEATARASAAVSDMAGHTAEVTAQAGSAVSDMAGRTAVGISRAAGDAVTTASDLGRQAQSRFSDLVEKHPLVLGGLGLALGAALAYSLRPTETEARLVG